MRPIYSLVAHPLQIALLCATTWLGGFSTPAAAQTTTTTTTTTTEPMPQPAAACDDTAAAAAAAAPSPTAPLIELPIQSAPLPAPPAVVTPLSNAAVLLMPQDQVLSNKGSWVRHGNELVLTHHDTSRSPRSSMIAAGITLLSTAYTPALIAGGLTTLFGGPTATGSTLLIPVIGPFLSGLAAVSNPRELGLGKNGAELWSWSWMLLDGGVQLTGLALLIAGARHRSAAAPSFVERVQILPYSAQNGGGVVISGRF